MQRVYLSDVFKFVQSFGQRGHQIGRKIGDALELITLGMVVRSENLAKFLIVEHGVEGATSAKHKVEFAFYNHSALGEPEGIPENLFGMIECKKVGVEATIQTGYKNWLAKHKGRKFFETAGYGFGQRTASGETRVVWVSSSPGNQMLSIKIDDDLRSVPVNSGDKILLAGGIDGTFYVILPENSLRSIDQPIQRCVIINIKHADGEGVREILIEECLPGPQTPEKAKQASFVSLDVRKKVIGTFDKTNNDAFISVLVIGESSHWEEKSRSMIRLCNDYNIIVPDEVVIGFFERMLELFGETYQDKIKKTSFLKDASIRQLVEDVIEHNNFKVLFDIASQKWVYFECEDAGNGPRLRVLPIA